MPAPRTEVTEIVTGLGMLPAGSVGDALTERPAELTNVDTETWDRLVELHRGGDYRAEFAAAWANGRAFLDASDGLRGRRPLVIEWKGNQRVPGHDPVPADLRVDHVYLVSCKYLSRILVNSAPSSLFDRGLGPGDGTSRDWYLEIAPDAYQELYRAVRTELPGDLGLPPFAADLTKAHRATLRHHLRGRWSEAVAPTARAFAAEVGRASAERWRTRLIRKRDRERMLWRLLRIANAPYFVLGVSGGETLRLRIATPWDWRQRFDLRSFDVWGDDAGQPQVCWQATVRDREQDDDVAVAGHVEIRWAHGRFAQAPEAKVYLDTPHHRVPGYFPLA